MFGVLKRTKTVYPAGAGNSSRAIAIAIVRSVYPRWRGELGEPHHQEHEAVGLSRWRGNSEVFRQGGQFITVYPAGAGNSSAPHLTPLPTAVYLRWRGNSL
ncbi:hypothetical protein OIU82_07195 [Escherichia coli]|nr:hypothetical protein [Escherichia coli]